MDVLVKIEVVTLFGNRRSEFFIDGRKKRRKSWTEAEVYINASMHKINPK